MISPMLPFMVAFITQSPVAVDLQAPAPVDLIKWASEKQVILIAQKYGGSDPHGDDPHGEDPNDEQHDRGLPANKEQKAHKAPKDVYGGEVPNDQAPY